MLGIVSDGKRINRLDMRYFKEESLLLDDFLHTSKKKEKQLMTP